MNERTNDFAMTLLTEKTPHEVFQAILSVRKWWYGIYEENITGNSDKLNDEFTFHAGGGAHYSLQRLIELVPDERVVWAVTDSKLTFIQKTDEWVGTRLIFNIARRAGKTEVVFTHRGLTPEAECYDSCAPGWTRYFQEKLIPLLEAEEVITAKL